MRHTSKTKLVNFRFSDEDLAKLDADRGSKSRTEHLRTLIHGVLTAEPDVRTEQPPLTEPVRTDECPPHDWEHNAYLGTRCKRCRIPKPR